MREGGFYAHDEFYVGQKVFCRGWSFFWWKPNWTFLGFESKDGTGQYTKYQMGEAVVVKVHGRINFHAEKDLFMYTVLKDGKEIMYPGSSMLDLAWNKKRMGEVYESGKDRVGEKGYSLNAAYAIEGLL